MLIFKIYSSLTSILSIPFSIFLSFISLFSFLHDNKLSLIMFFREGFYIDDNQRSSLGKLLKNLLVSSTQFFNINFYNYKFIKFLIDDIYKLFGEFLGDKSSLSISFVLQSLIFYFIFLFNFSITLLFLFL